VRHIAFERCWRQSASCSTAYTGQQEIIAGFQSTGREHHQLEDQIGAYLNTVVLRAMLEPARSIAETVSSIVRRFSKRWTIVPTHSICFWRNFDLERR